MFDKPKQPLQPVGTLAELAELVASSVVSRAVNPAHHEKLYRKALGELIQAGHRGHLTLCAATGDSDPAQRGITRESALDWWESQPLPLPPALLTTVVMPVPTSDPRGDYRLDQLARFAWNPGQSPEQLDKRIDADVHAGKLRLATRSLSGHRKFNKVTRFVAAEWLQTNGFKLPAELADLRPPDPALA